MKKIKLEKLIEWSQEEPTFKGLLKKIKENECLFFLSNQVESPRIYGIEEIKEDYSIVFEARDRDVISADDYSNIDKYSYGILKNGESAVYSIYMNPNKQK